MIQSFPPVFFFFFFFSFVVPFLTGPPTCSPYESQDDLKSGVLWSPLVGLLATVALGGVFAFYRNKEKKQGLPDADPSPEGMWRLKGTPITMIGLLLISVTLGFSTHALYECNEDASNLDDYLQCTKTYAGTNVFFGLIGLISMLPALRFWKENTYAYLGMGIWQRIEQASLPIIAWVISVNSLGIGSYNVCVINAEEDHDYDAYRDCDDVEKGFAMVNFVVVGLMLLAQLYFIFSPAASIQYGAHHHQPLLH